MTIDIECQNCAGDFELDVESFLEAPKAIKCPHCKAKLDVRASENLATTLEDLLAQLKAISKKFAISFAVDPEDLEVAKKQDEEEEEDDDDADDDEVFDDDEAAAADEDEDS